MASLGGAEGEEKGLKGALEGKWNELNDPNDGDDAEGEVDEKPNCEVGVAGGGIEGASVANEELNAGENEAGEEEDSSEPLKGNAGKVEGVEEAVVVEATGDPKMGAAKGDSEDTAGDAGEDARLNVHGDKDEGVVVLPTVFGRAEEEDDDEEVETTDGKMGAANGECFAAGGGCHPWIRRSNHRGFTQQSLPSIVQLFHLRR